MIRVVVYLILLAALAYAGMLLIQNPGHITLSWYGEVINTSAALGIAAIGLAAIILWVVLRLFFGLPSIMSYAAKRRRREKGYAALSRGLIAVHSGDVRAAQKASTQASRQLKDDSLAVMLRAQAAHLAGDGQTAQAAYEELAEREDTRVLGLRGLYAEANRRGDDEAARHFAAAAHRASPLPWSAQAVLEHRATEQDWETALATVESSIAAKLVDKATGERQRAVLETALAQEKEMTAPDAALALARSAIKRAPNLAPPVVVAAQLLTRRGDIGKASRLIEKAWPSCQHPDIAQAYLDVRPGDSTTDKLARARTLMGLSAFDPVARMTVARAAIASKDFATARSAMEPLVGQGKRPTIKMCMLMAELEESEHGSAGLSREWQARASHAALDPAWIADGTVYDHWAPISPTTGRLDAFVWQVPVERMGRVMDAMPARPAGDSPALGASRTPYIDHHETTAMIAAPSANSASVSEKASRFEETREAADGKAADNDAHGAEAGPAGTEAHAPTLVKANDIAPSHPVEQAPVEAHAIGSDATPTSEPLENGLASRGAEPVTPSASEATVAKEPAAGEVPATGADQRANRRNSIFTSG